MDARLVLSKNNPVTTSIQIAPNCTASQSKELLIIGGPCSVESLEQMETVARELEKAPVSVIRGGVFKPRTSPYAFQGMGVEGIEILASIRKQSGLPVVTEVMSPQHLELCEPFVDMLQIGSRNMQNFELLKEVGKSHLPVILKRGLAATIEEFVLAAEYIMSEGNHNVILCERGIRSFDSFTRNVLDLGCVVALKQMTHLPVIVDPSHAAGKRELVADLAMAAIACGADGLMIECHPVPEESVSDARQALSLEDMCDLVERLRPIAATRGRTIATPPVVVETKSSDTAVRGMTLSEFRNEIDEIDNPLVELLERRLRLARKIGSAKLRAKLPVKDELREKELFARVESLISDPSLSTHIRDVFKEIIEQSIEVQIDKEARSLAS